MGVNLAASYAIGGAPTRGRVSALVLPLLGFLVCFYLWLSCAAKWRVSAVAGAGLIYGALKTRWSSAGTSCRSTCRRSRRRENGDTHLFRVSPKVGKDECPHFLSYR